MAPRSWRNPQEPLTGRVYSSADEEAGKPPYLTESPASGGSRVRDSAGGTPRKVLTCAGIRRKLQAQQDKSRWCGALWEIPAELFNVKSVSFRLHVPTFLNHLSPRAIMKVRACQGGTDHGTRGQWWRIGPLADMTTESPWQRVSIPVLAEVAGALNPATMGRAACPKAHRQS